MDHKRSKKTLVQSLYDRSGNRPRLRRLNSRDSTISVDFLEDIVQRIERIENEMIRYNKVLTMYIDRIEDLETNIEKITKQMSNLQKITSISNNNNNDNKTNTLNSNNSSTSSNTTIATSSIIGGTYNSSTTSDTLIRNQNQKLSTWMRFTKFFKQRPSVETLKKKNIYKNEPCFDTEIENVIKHERYRTIPKIVIECIEIIEHTIKITPSIDGLYRTSGNYVEIQKLRFEIDSNNYDCLHQIKDIHTIVGLLKLFFREIKSPLIKSSEIRAFIGTSREWTLASIKYKVDVLQKLVKTLPEVNRDTLSYFLKHLCRLTRTPLQFVNSRSLAVSLTPTIFHSTFDQKCDIHVTMKESEILANCFEIMIEYCDRIFEVPYKRMSKQLTKCISCPKLNI